MTAFLTWLRYTGNPVHSLVVVCASLSLCYQGIINVCVMSGLLGPQGHVKGHGVKPPRETSFRLRLTLIDPYYIKCAIISDKLTYTK